MSLDGDILWWGIIIFLFILSYIGLVAPGIPDAPLMFAGFLVYHFFIDDESLSWWFWMTMVILLIIMVVLDWVSGGLAAKKLGGSKGTMIAAPLGAICFFWLPFGIILGPFLLCLALELWNRKPINLAFKIAMATVVGFISNIVVKIIVLTSAKAWFFYLAA